MSLEGFEVLQAGDIKSGLTKLDMVDMDIVMWDVKLRDGSGVETAKTIKDKRKPPVYWKSRQPLYTGKLKNTK